MSFESSPLLKDVSSKKNSVDETDAHEKARVGFATIYENSSDPNKRLSDIMKHVDPFFKHIDKTVLSEEEIDNIKIKLQTCLSIQDKDEFANFVTQTLEPLIAIKNNNPTEFEKTHAQAMNESHGFTEINRLLSYGKSGSIVHIHAPAGATVDNKITLYRDGMSKLATIIHDDPEIQDITATSYIVTEHPGLFKRAGFTIEDVTEKFRAEHFADEKGVIKKATISRKDFLQRFYKE